MFDRVYFYCHFGAGDIFESREFVRDMISIIPAYEYFYAHGKNPLILKDMENIISTEVTSIMDAGRAIYQNGNDLYVNTWIGRDSEYVLPGIGCVLPKYHEMYNEMLQVAGFRRLHFDAIDYLPVINYKYFDLDGVNSYIEKDINKKVLICNGLVQSSQAENFDFEPIIKDIAARFPDISFIVANRTGVNLPNIFFTGDITKVIGFDLNEISYLSTFCDVIVGRSSGPFLFSQTKGNWMNPNKTFLSFTYRRTGANIVLDLPVLAKKLWCPCISTPENISERIAEVLI